MDLGGVVSESCSSEQFSGQNLPDLWKNKARIKLLDGDDKMRWSVQQEMNRLLQLTASRPGSHG